MNPKHRREFLKAFVALPFIIPSQWQKPIIRVGSIPPFAQISTLIISDPVSEFPPSGINNCLIQDTIVGSQEIISFRYQISPGADIYSAVILYSSNVTYVGAPEIPLTDSSVQVNEATQQIQLRLCTRFGSNERLSNQVQLKFSDGTISEVLTFDSVKPVGAQDVPDDLPAQRKLISF